MSGRVNCGVCAFVVVLAISVGLFGGSFAIVSPNYVGLKYNSVSVALDKSSIYLPGRYFVGLGNQFFLYPTTWQLVSFSDDGDSDSLPIKTKNKDGQEVSLEISFMYRLRMDRLPQLYDTYPSRNFHSDYVIKAKDAIQKVPQVYTNDDILAKREQIANEMSNAIQQALSVVFADVQLFQLRDIQLVRAFEDRLVSQQVTNRQQKTKQNEQQITVISAEIDVINAQAGAQISSSLASAYSTGNVTVATATATATQTVLSAQSSVYRTLATGLNFTSTELLRYIWLDTVRTTDAASLVAGFSANAPQLRVTP